LKWRSPRRTFEGDADYLAEACDRADVLARQRLKRGRDRFQGDRRTDGCAGCDSSHKREAQPVLGYFQFGQLRHV